MRCVAFEATARVIFNRRGLSSAAGSRRSAAAVRVTGWVGAIKRARADPILERFDPSVKGGQADGAALCCELEAALFDHRQKVSTASPIPNLALIRASSWRRITLLRGDERRSSSADKSVELPTARSASRKGFRPHLRRSMRRSTLETFRRVVMGSSVIAARGRIHVKAR